MTWEEYQREVAILHAEQRELDKYKMEKQVEINERWEQLNSHRPKS